MTPRPDRGTELAGAAIGGASFGFCFIGAVQACTTEPRFGLFLIVLGAILAGCSAGLLLLARKTP